MAIESWSKCRVHGTWMDAEGNRLPGSVVTTISARVTNTAENVIIPAGKYVPGCVKLGTSAAAPSLDFQCPATDDPDIPETGWGVTVVVTFENTGVKAETYVLDAIPSDGVIDLRTVVPTAVPRPLGAASLKLGQPGGVALLDAGGAVVDANGIPVTSAAAPNITAEVVGTGEPSVEIVGTYPNLKFAFTMPATSGTSEPIDPDPVDPVDPTPTVSKNAFLVGDSLTAYANSLVTIGGTVPHEVDSTGKLVQHWTDGGFNLHWRALAGHFIQDAASTSEPTTTAWLDQLASEGSADVYVIQLGTNMDYEDNVAWSESTDKATFMPPTTVSDIHLVLDKIKAIHTGTGKPKVLWCGYGDMNFMGTVTWGWNRTYAAAKADEGGNFGGVHFGARLNSVIQEVCSADTGIEFRFIDWLDFIGMRGVWKGVDPVTEQAWWFDDSGDNTHMSTDGYAARDALVIGEAQNWLGM